MKKKKRRIRAKKVTSHKKLGIYLVVGLFVLMIGIIAANKVYQQHERQAVETNIGRINPKTTVQQENKRNQALQQKVKQHKIAPQSPSFDFSKVTPINYADSKKAQKYAGRYTHTGMIKIPAIGVRSAITEGMSNYALYSSVGTAKPNQTMGTGNYALGGHNNYDYGRNGYLFSMLSAAKVGQLIYLTDFKQVYVYRIYDRQVISASQSEIIQDNRATNQQPVITLFTCWSPNHEVSTNKRLMIRGQLESKNKNINNF